MTDNARLLSSREREVTLLETLDRLLNRGVVVAGDMTLSVADVDLIYVGLRLLISSVETATRLRFPDAVTEARTSNPLTLPSPPRGRG